MREAARWDRYTVRRSGGLNRETADDPHLVDFYTVRDQRTSTGRRVAFDRTMMPVNVAGTPVDPTEWNRNDGFSPGSMLLANIPGLDLERTGAAPITDIGSSLSRNAPIVLIDTDTGRRHPYWAELDANATQADRKALIVRPARNLIEGHRYVAALRDLRDGTGARIQANPAFRAMLDDRPPADPALRDRWATLRPVLRDLRRAAIGTRDLNLAWDFTVASERNTTGRALHMRDESFRALGEAAPKVEITEVIEHTPEQEPDLARTVQGRVTVPKYLTGAGAPGSRMTFGPDDRPEAEGTYEATFRCVVPRKALDAPARPVLFGHGLFGGHDSVDGMKGAANEANALFCATSWIGMSDEDVLFLLTMVRDLSGFPALPDRLQQSYLNVMFLGRAMIHQDGLAAEPAFRTADGRPLLDRRAGLGYLGGSLGGIQGTALAGLAQDFRRAVLVVPGVNFSTLLNRSRLFAPFQAGLDASYPDRMRQQVGLSLMQMLWDRGEGNGYVAHVTRDPLPRTPAKRVLLHEAVGDHQVANIATEVEARTLGIPLREPATGPGRSPDVDPQWGLAPLFRDVHHGSALMIWDSGSPLPPQDNRPPMTGHDPHGDTGNTPAARAQAAEFLRSGTVTEVCGTAPCLAIPTG
ncbi:MAG: hypothetical protein GEV11_10540 [Streptosporangiales bacterium]|nr:hypothetical protein [Streptosporangiales bacterium]